MHDDGWESTAGPLLQASTHRRTSGVQQRLRITIVESELYSFHSTNLIRDNAMFAPIPRSGFFLGDSTDSKSEDPPPNWENGDELQDADRQEKAWIQEQKGIKEEMRIKEEWSIKEEGGTGFYNPSDFAVESAEYDEVCITLASTAFIYTKGLKRELLLGGFVDLRYHYNTTSDANSLSTHCPLEYPCLHPNCGHISQRAHDLKRHMVIHFPPAVEELLDCKYGWCGRTGALGFKREDHRKEHYRKVHMEESEYVKKRKGENSGSTGGGRGPGEDHRIVEEGVQSSG